MYRLLIVDDEPYSVDGLFEMLQETKFSELDIYRAYSAQEALQWLDRGKIDIVLSDIRMPGMDGLQLQRLIKERWPRCKVIFLTGINDAQYVRQALRDGSVDYILKTEGDAPILQSLGTAIESLDNELHNESFILQAKARLKEALPVLRNNWFRRLLQYGTEDVGLAHARLAELVSPLNADMQVLPVLIRVDRWPDHISGMDRSLLTYAIENIVSEYLASLSLQIITVDDAYFMLLVQPNDQLPETGRPEWDGTLRYVQGTMETVQSTCSSLLKLPISVMCCHGAVQWDMLADTYFSMRKSLVLGLATGENMMLLTKFNGNGNAGLPEYASETLAARLRERLDSVLEGGRPEEIHAAIDALFEGTHEYTFYLEAYYTVANKLIGLVNRMGWADKLEPHMRPELLMNIHSHSTREQAVQFLHGVAERLSALKKRIQDERTDRIVEKVNRFIRERIDQDVSLTAIAEAVYLNPSYLSVLYKQTTGQNISDYITSVRLDIAKDLLCASQLKVHEIAAAIGFDNAGYFTRFFRKHTQIGPQEYRNQNWK